MTTGRVLDEAQKQVRDGTVDAELLKKLDMTSDEYRRFVGKYSQLYNRVRDSVEKDPDAPTVVRREYTLDEPGEVREGTGTDREITDVSGGEDLTPDQMRELLENRKRRVSPEYRKGVESYLRAISEMSDDGEDDEEGSGDD
ncbi:MAG: hypothetical protein ACLFVU_10440 [Phycisphaerae bacterium]